MSDATAKWQVEDNQPNHEGNFSIVTKSEIQTQVTVAVTEAVAVTIVRDHNAHDPLVAALEYLEAMINLNPAGHVIDLDGARASAYKARAALEAVGSRNGEAKR